MARGGAFAGPALRVAPFRRWATRRNTLRYCALPHTSVAASLTRRSVESPRLKASGVSAGVTAAGEDAKHLRIPVPHTRDAHWLDDDVSDHAASNGKNCTTVATHRFAHPTPLMSIHWRCGPGSFGDRRDDIDRHGIGLSYPMPRHLSRACPATVTSHPPCR
jgi:hypothetical protein